NETSRGLAAAGGIAAGVDSDVSLPLDQLAFPVVIDADRVFVGFMELAEGPIDHTDRAGHTGDRNGRKRAVAVKRAAVAANPGPTSHQLQPLGNHEVAPLELETIIKQPVVPGEKRVSAAGRIDDISHAVGCRAEVVQVAEPPVVQESESGVLTGKKNVVGV